MVYAGDQPVPPVPTATAATTNAGPNAPGPKIQFAEPIHDFGRTKAGETVKYTYYFTNTGVQVLELTHVQPSCGCTTATDYSKKVEPGQVGTIPLQFNSANFNGQVLKTVAVSSNDKSQPTVVLQLKGTIWKPIDFIPAYTVLNIPPDAGSGSATVRITNNMPEPLELLSIDCANKSVATELKTNYPGKEYALSISTIPPLHAGAMQGQVIVKTSSTNSPTLNIPFWLNVQPAVMLIPSQITLAPGPLPNKTTPSLTIQNNSTNALKLTDAALNVPGVEFELKEMQPGRTFTAVLNFPQGFEMPQGQAVFFTAKTSHPLFPEIKVPVVQLARPVTQTLPAGPVRNPALAAPRPPAPASGSPRPPTVAAPAPGTAGPAPEKQSL
jgi:copper(I)-binding protein